LLNPGNGRKTPEESDGAQTLGDSSGFERFLSGFERYFCSYYAHFCSFYAQNRLKTSRVLNNPGITRNN